MSILRRAFCVAVATALTAIAPQHVVAQDEAQEPPEVQAKAAPSGLRVQSAVALRAVPEGFKLNLVGGYRFGLFESNSILLKNTYAETGVFSEVSPSNLWVGPYLEVLPLAVLKFWVSAQSLSYYGTFGYLHVPEDQENPDWALDSIADEVAAGQPAHGWMIDARVTPQAKVGNLVVLGETQFAWVNMGVDGKYYESTFDFLLEPTDSFWVTRPTLGWVFPMERGWVLTGARWEHGETLGTDITRDMASLLVLWRLPWALLDTGAMTLATVAGYWVHHPNRQNTPYLAAQLSVDWAP